MLSRFRRHVLTRLALLALEQLGFCMAGIASVSPELHRHLHHDADQNGHECLVTTLVSGGMDYSPTVPFVVQPPMAASAELIASEGIACRSFFLDCSVFEHGPPVLS
jgi:hypothetical protein